MLRILRCNISRDFSTEGPGFVSMSPDSRRIKNMNSCAKKLILRDQEDNILHCCLKILHINSRKSNMLTDLENLITDFESIL